MTVREYLNRPEALRREIARMRARIDTLRRLATRLAAPPQEVRVRTSPDPSRMQSLLAEVADGEKEVLLMEEKLREVLADTALYISFLPDEKMIRVMEMRYLDGCSWEETLLRLDYSRSHIYRIHQQALALLPPPPEDPEDFS